jgi:hypothetical protein
MEMKRFKLKRKILPVVAIAFNLLAVIKIEKMGL